MEGGIVEGKDHMTFSFRLIYLFWTSVSFFKMMWKEWEGGMDAAEFF